MSWAIADMAQRMERMISIGTVESVSGDTCRVRVFGLLTAPLPWLVPSANSRSVHDAAPVSGEQVLLLAPSGDLQQAVVIRALYRAAHPAGTTDEGTEQAVFGDGAQVSYSTGSGVMVAQPASELRLGSSSASDPVVRQSDLQAAVDALLQAINEHTHPAPGGATGSPTPPLTPVTASGSSVVKAS